MDADRFFRPAIAAIAGYTPGEQPQIPGLIKLNTNESPYPPSPRVQEALTGADWERLNRYPDPLASSVRAAAAALVGGRPEQILACNGSDDSLTILVRSFVDDGGVMACLDPSYSLYPVLAELQGAECRRIALGKDFSFPPDLAALAGNASLLVLCRPNAPTGNVMPLEYVARACRAFAGIVVVDEAYADFAADNCAALVPQYPNLVLTRTLSKGYALAGLRLGYVYADAGLIAGLVKVKDSYNVNTLTQVLGTAALRDQDWLRQTVAKVRATRERVGNALRALGATVAPSQANFLFVRPPAPLAAAAYAQALREERILLRYFPGPRTGEHVRVTMGTEPEMDAFLAASARLFAKP